MLCRELYTGQTLAGTLDSTNHLAVYTAQYSVHCLHLTLHHPFTRIVGWAVGWLIENDELQETLIITILSLTCHLFVYFLLDILHQFRSHLHILLSFKFSVHTHRILSMQAARVRGGACFRNLM